MRGLGEVPPNRYPGRPRRSRSLCGGEGQQVRIKCLEGELPLRKQFPGPDAEPAALEAGPDNMPELWRRYRGRFQQAATGPEAAPDSVGVFRILSVLPAANQPEFFQGECQSGALHRVRPLRARTGYLESGPRQCVVHAAHLADHSLELHHGQGA